MQALPGPDLDEQFQRTMKRIGHPEVIKYMELKIRNNGYS